MVERVVITEKGCRQAQLNLAVARATGESIATVIRLGFSRANLLRVHFISILFLRLSPSRAKARRSNGWNGSTSSSPPRVSIADVLVGQGEGCRGA